MTVQEIIKDYLKRNKWDGLCNDDCGCDVDELMPCNQYVGDCQPAVKRICGDKRKAGCEEDCGGECYTTNTAGSRRERAVNKVSKKLSLISGKK